MCICQHICSAPIYLDIHRSASSRRGNSYMAKCLHHYMCLSASPAFGMSTQQRTFPSCGHEHAIADYYQREPSVIWVAFVQRQDELMLSEAFHEGARHTRRQLGSGTPLQIINFDWHGMMKDLKEKETVRCLWEHLQGLLPRSDLSSGSMEPVAQHSSAGPSDR